MGRYSTNRAYNQHIEFFGRDCYRLSWTVDRYYRGSRLRFPTRYSRDTDFNGAERFAKKHGLALPIGFSS